jgi:hypothetical protein
VQRSGTLACDHYRALLLCSYDAGSMRPASLLQAGPMLTPRIPARHPAQTVATPYPWYLARPRIQITLSPRCCPRQNQLNAPKVLSTRLRAWRTNPGSSGTLHPELSIRQLPVWIYVSASPTMRAERDIRHSLVMHLADKSLVIATRESMHGFGRLPL